LSIHLVSIALLLSLAVALTLALKVGGQASQKSAASPAIATSARAERVVVMPTAGGRLEVATVAAHETLTRANSKMLLDLIDLGTTVSEIRVDAAYRFHIGMAKAWPLRIAGKTCVVHAGTVEPTLPAAFDSATIERRTASGWARFNKAQNLRALEKSLTEQLAERSSLYGQQAQEAGRQVVEEFVAAWLLREQQWKRDAELRVVVLFPKEPTDLTQH